MNTIYGRSSLHKVLGAKESNFVIISCVMQASIYKRKGCSRANSSNLELLAIRRQKLSCVKHTPRSVHRASSHTLQLDSDPVSLYP